MAEKIVDLQSIAAPIFDMKTRTVRKKLPPVIACPTAIPPFMWQYPADSWNCGLCGAEKAFHQPYKVGDQLPFQFRLPNFVNGVNAPTVGFATTNTPSAGTYAYKAFLVDCDCNLIASEANVTNFSTKFGHYWTEKDGHFQQIELNTSLLPAGICCFSIRIQAVNSAGTVVYEQTSEPFGRAEAPCATCDKPTVLIEAEHETKDCEGRVFGQTIGGEAFKIRFRVYGSIESYSGFSFNRTTNDNGDVISKDFKTRYRFRGGLVPPYFFKMFANAASAESFKIGGIKIDDIEGIERNNEANRMAHLDFEFSATCKLSNFECD